MPAEAFSLAKATELTLRNRPHYRLHYRLHYRPHYRPHYRRWLWLLLLGASAYAQTCQSAVDMQPSVRTSLEAAARRYFEMSANGDAASLKQNSIPAVASSFAGIETALKENQSAFAGAKATVRPPFLLTADGPALLPRAEFLCGVFGSSGQTKDSAVFVLNNLPPGKYGVTILDVNGSKDDPKTLTFVLQQTGADWKLAGFYAKASRAAGHDAAWFTGHARDFKAKAQNHNAWLYYREAIALSAPWISSAHSIPTNSMTNRRLRNPLICQQMATRWI